MARRLCTVLVASLFLLTAACGTTDDKADEKTTTTKDDKKTTTTEGDDEPTVSTVDDGDDDETTTTEGGGDGGNSEFCEASADLDSLFDDLDEGDYQGLVDAIKDADDMFEAYVDSLPDDLKENGELLIDSVRTLAQQVDQVKDDPDVETKVEEAYNDLDTPELNEASDAIDAYETENCPNN